MTTFASQAVDRHRSPTTRKYPQPMKRLRLVLASLALTAVPIVTQPSPASAAMLWGCNLQYNSFSDSSYCDTMKFDQAGLGQQRAAILCRRSSDNATAWRYGGWVGIATWSTAFCPSGFSTDTVTYQKR